VSAEAKLLDSSIWIEIFRSGPLHRACERELKSAKQVVVPTLVLFEVYKKIALRASEDQALSALALITQHQIVDLSQEVALTAADLAIHHKMGMADSIVLAHAHTAQATLVTLNNDFASVDGVRVLRP
jgi:toxin FitB